MVLDEDKTVGAVARELDLTASALSLWVRQARSERTKGKSRLMKEEREELTGVAPCLDSNQPRVESWTGFANMWKRRLAGILRSPLAGHA